MRWWRELGIVTAVASAVTVVSTWPLLPHLNRVANDPYDPRFQAWTIDWVQWALLNDESLWDANMFAPAPDSLAFSDALIGLAVPMIPLGALGVTPIGMVNLALLLGTVANTVAGYLLGRVVTRRVAGGVVVGSAAAFGPFATYLTQHVHILVHPGVPLGVALVWMVADRHGEQVGRSQIDDGVPSWLLWAGVSASLAWQGLVSFYAATFTGLAVVIAAAVRWRALGRRGLVSVGAALVVGAAPLALVALPYLENQDRYPTYEFTLDDGGFFAADVTAADPRLTLWGSLATDDAIPVFQGAAFPGAVLALTALAGAVVGWRSGSEALRSATRLGVALGAVGGVLALGGDTSGWRRFTPYTFLFEHAPGWSSLRASARFWVIAVLGFGVLAAVAVLRIGELTGGRRRATVVVVALTVVVAAGSVVEGHRDWSDLTPTRVFAVDRTIADLPPGGVVYLPVNVGESLNLTSREQAGYVYRSTAHHRSLVNGYAGFVPPTYLELSERLAGLPGRAALGCLVQHGIRYVVVTPAVKGTPWADLRQPSSALPLRLLEQHGGDLLYEIPDGVEPRPCPLS